MPAGKAFCRVFRSAPHFALKRGPDCVKPWRKRIFMGREGGGAAAILRKYQRARRLVRVTLRGIKGCEGRGM